MICGYFGILLTVLRTKIEPLCYQHVKAYSTTDRR